MTCTTQPARELFSRRPVLCRSMQGWGIFLTSKSGYKCCCTPQYYSTLPPQQRRTASQVSTTEPRLKTSHRAKCFNWLEKDQEADSASCAVLKETYKYREG